MDRESAKLLGFSKEARKTEYSGNYIHLDNVIDIVYDDFESRTCENCDNNQLDTENDGIFGWCNVICYQIVHFKTSKDFYCNKHEPKET